MSNLRRFATSIIALLLFVAVMRLAVAQTAGVSVLTNRYDNLRDGQNASEVTLTPANVNAGSFGKLFSSTLDGNAYGQPLYVPSVSIGGTTHNVVYVATENDSVYAIDADRAGSPLWQVSFLNAANNVTTVSSQIVSAKNPLPGCVDIKPQYGITSTPVIDPASNTIYVVANTNDNGTINYRLHALDITTGQEKFGGPVLIQASVPGTGDDNDGNGNVIFDPTQELQRSALLLVNGVVYIGFGSHCDLDPWHGWLLGYSASSLSQLYVYNTTPNGSEGAIWASGTGPATDQSGDVFLTTGNGTFDSTLTPPVDLGNAMLRLGVRNGNFGVVDYFVPSNWMPLNSSDYDLGSAGATLLPDQPTGPMHLMVTAGKNGTIALFNRDNLGQFNSSSDNILQEIPSPNPDTILNWSTPAYWNGLTYFIMSKDVPRSFTLSNAMLTPASTGTRTFPFLGSQPVISANGTTNGILWTLENKGSTVTTGAGLLHAWNALNLTQELYNSDQNGARDVPGPSTKFNVVTVVNGKVYVGTQTEIDVYGLTTSASPTPTASATSAPTATPTPTVVAITAPANNATVSGNVAITVFKATSVSWANVYIDGNYFASTPPLTFTFNSTTVPNGSHQISVTGFAANSAVLGSASINVTVNNGGATATATATAVATRTATLTATPTATLTPTATATATATASATPTATTTSGATPTLTATSGATPTATATVVATATATATAVATATATAVSTPTATATLTATAVPSPTPTSSVVAITAPLNNATVSGTVPITVTKSSGVTWVNVYIDGNYFASTPPLTFSWNSATVANGSHTISATAFAANSTVLGSTSITVTVSNGGATPTATATTNATATPTTTATPHATATPTMVSTATTIATATATTNATPTATATTVATATATVIATATATVIATATATLTRTATPTAMPTPGVVQITAPANGANVKGTAVPITVQKSAGVTWVNVYIDGTYFASTPPLTFSWNSTTVPDGAHTISATAFAANSTVLGSTSITVNVVN